MKYKIDRTKFIDYMLSDEEDRKYATAELKDSLKMSGEFIVTATELLDRCASIPVELLENYDGTAEYVDGSECELIYKHPFE